MEQTWIDTYYESLEFLYWEPQHLRPLRVKSKSLSGIDAARKRIRLLEVTLNHQLKHLFCLAPSKLRNRVFEAALERSVPGTFRLVEKDVNALYGLAGAMQPDFLFVGPEHSISLEMKIEAKSSVDQVLKYALLALAVEQKTKCCQQHSLILSGRHKFPEFWREKFGCVDDLRLSLKERKAVFLRKKAPKSLAIEPRFSEIIQSLEMSYLTYQEFAGVLCAEQTSLDGSVPAEVYGKLLQGTLGELSRRQLIDEHEARSAGL